MREKSSRILAKIIFDFVGLKKRLQFILRPLIADAKQHNFLAAPFTGAYHGLSLHLNAGVKPATTEGTKDERILTCTVPLPRRHASPIC